VCVLAAGARKDHEKCEFEVHEVYGIDVLVSTGDGKVCVCDSSDFSPCVCVHCNLLLQ